MTVVGTLLKNAVKRTNNHLNKKRGINSLLQEDTLRKLLKKALYTQFGKTYEFSKILNSPNLADTFRKSVPVYDYEKIYEEWWNKLLKGEENVCWPGKVKYFGLTSGTSNDSSKRVPVTRDMIRSIRKTGIRQLLVLGDLELPSNFFKKRVLMLGGSTDLIKMDDYFEGDLSGILAGNLPSWFNAFYKPGIPIARERDWNAKLEKIVREARKWDIGAMAGVPAWIQIMMEKIIDHYGLNTIHDIWPNFRVYSHGGVSFAPYRKSFEKLLGKEVYFLETYLASEGFLAYQRKADTNMQLVLDNGIFFEFIPFNEKNFTTDGGLKENPETLLLSEIEENQDYALLISTCAGAWRYLIGDTIRFTNAENYEITITGRTRHFLSLCGEHLSLDNMTKAIEMVADELNIEIKEFTVAGIPYKNMFAHKWYLGTNAPEVGKNILKQKLDTALKELNDDYRTERKAALKEVLVEILPVEVFYEYLKYKGKEGGQHKFPRVINGQYKDWENFVKIYQSGSVVNK